MRCLVVNKILYKNMSFYLLFYQQPFNRSILAKVNTFQKIKILV